MSKTSKKNKELKAAGKLPAKGTSAGPIDSADAEAEAPRRKGLPNEGHCCTCQSYHRENGRATPCPKKKAYTPRKSTCGSYKLASRYR